MRVLVALGLVLAGGAACVGSAAGIPGAAAGPPGAAAGAPDASAGSGEASRPPADTAAIRVNQLGYRPGDRKVAVLCSTGRLEPATFEVLGASDGRPVLGPRAAEDAGSFGPCASVQRLDFSEVIDPGRYVVRAGALVSPPVRIAADVYAGAADTTLLYLRQQRSGFNPLFRDSVHHRTDAILVDHPRAGEFIPVAGGWADAADYLQYVTTSAAATFSLLKAGRDHAGAFADAYGSDGLPGANGLSDVLDEARWGLEWLLKMYPRDDLLLNQIGDDRDHAFLDLPPTDSSDYGWGKGGYRPVYPCTGRPQGLLGNRNRSDGLASTAGKMAAAFALGAEVFREREPAFARRLTGKARAAYELGRSDPGTCQTAPARAPYFYEEDDWVDDMELAAAALHGLTGEERYGEEAAEYAELWPVSPWMGADTARHYQWYPWFNHGHHEIWRNTAAGPSAPPVPGDRASPGERMAAFYRRGLEAVASRAENGFRIGIPFIWCSNDLVVALATQALLYREMTGDTAFVEMEAAARDWLFGTNPWGTSMVVAYPDGGEAPEDPHSVVALELGTWSQKGGLVDGPVYRSIFESLLWVRLADADELAPWNTGHVVYHDDWGDYSTNEPIMDGTAHLAYLLAALASGR